MGRDIPDPADAGQSIPVPAAVAETLAEAAHDNADNLRERGFPKVARRVEECASLALKTTATARGSQFVSLDAYTLGTITAHRGRGLKPRYAQTARTFLEQYGHWNARDDDVSVF